MGRPKEAATLRNRRHELELRVADVVERSGGLVNQKLLSRIENGHLHPSRVRNDQYRALLEVLQWTEAEYQAALAGEPTSPPATTPELAPRPTAPAPSERAPAPGAERFRLLRERSGLSLRDVAARTQGAISYSTVHQLETRDDDALEGVTIGTLRALARAYELPLVDLVRLVFDEAPPPVPARVADMAKRDATEHLARSAIVDLRFQTRQLERRLRYLEEQLDALDHS